MLLCYVSFCNGLYQSVQHCSCSCYPTIVGAVWFHHFTSVLYSVMVTATQIPWGSFPAPSKKIYMQCWSSNVPHLWRNTTHFCSFFYSSTPPWHAQTLAVLVPQDVVKRWLLRCVSGIVEGVKLFWQWFMTVFLVSSFFKCALHSGLLIWHCY